MQQFVSVSSSPFQQSVIPSITLSLCLSVSLSLCLSPLSDYELEVFSLFRESLMQCNNTQTQEQIIDMKRSDFFIVIILFYSWVSYIHEGAQNFTKSSQTACYQDPRDCTAHLHPQVTGRALWKERGRGQAAGHMQPAEI